MMDVVEKIFMDMFAGLKEQCAKDLATIAAQYPCEPIEAKPVRLTFEGERARGERFFSFRFVVFFPSSSRFRLSPSPLLAQKNNTNTINNPKQRASRSCARTATRTLTL